MKQYVDTRTGKAEDEPLPLAARNILGHRGQNPNTLTTSELTTAIELLRQWTARRR